ncbi:probable tRNA (cytidine-2'-O-)-methyltransferase TrmJ [Coccomyxa sp. Obi]|nr:probable tRNA (cytidine-2'-O-)-methyltransferase TrmJ [Coccomyxa sp. Obi]
MIAPFPVGLSPLNFATTSEVPKTGLLRVSATCQSSQPREERGRLLENIRNSKRGTLQRFWKPDLEPPAALGNLSVVLVGPQKPPNVGAVARACNCFEAEDLRIVGPSCPITVRSAQNAAMGGQRLLWQASEFGSVEDAVEGCYSVAFTRWQDGRDGQAAFGSIGRLVHELEQRGLLGQKDADIGDRVAFVFGREVSGLLPSEVAACDAVCSIQMGRLQESLSLSHAVAIALCAAFECNLKYR